MGVGVGVGVGVGAKARVRVVVRVRFSEHLEVGRQLRDGGVGDAVGRDVEVLQRREVR